MSDPVMITLKATNKADLAQKLRLGAKMGWKVRYTLDRDNALLLADAIDDCLTVEAETERASCSVVI